MAKRSRRWSNDELVLAYELYCVTPFGRLHHRNPDVISLAETIDRTPSAVAMKLVNFASLDETQRARGIRGLSNASAADRQLVESFQSNWSNLAERAEEIRAGLESRECNAIGDPAHDGIWVSGPTDRQATVKVRIVQRFFRSAVIASYNGTCAICGIHHAELLTASHIIPWAEREERRADPTNGLCLCAIHDRAFDRGLIAVNEELRIAVARTLLQKADAQVYRNVFGCFDGRPLTLPERFHPDPAALQLHFATIFKPRNRDDDHP